MLIDAKTLDVIYGLTKFIRRATVVPVLYMDSSHSPRLAPRI
jgi:hypothetical protein